MPNMKSLSFMVQKLQRSISLQQTDKETNKQTDRQTNKQTGQKQYAPNHLIQGHKKIG